MLPKARGDQPPFLGRLCHFRSDHRVRFKLLPRLLVLDELDPHHEMRSAHFADHVDITETPQRVFEHLARRLHPLGDAFPLEDVDIGEPCRRRGRGGRNRSCRAGTSHPAPRSRHGFHLK